MVLVAVTLVECSGSTYLHVLFLTLGSLGASCQIVSVEFKWTQRNTEFCRRCTHPRNKEHSFSTGCNWSANLVFRDWLSCSATAWLQHVQTLTTHLFSHVERTQKAKTFPVLVQTVFSLRCTTQLQCNNCLKLQWRNCWCKMAFE